MNQFTTFFLILNIISKPTVSLLILTVMKKLILFLFLATSIGSFAQNKNLLKDITTIKFYGVDYSQVKVYGASETPKQFKAAFAEINKLFITQPKKYDVGERLKKNISEISLEAVDQVNAKIKPNELMTTDKTFTLSDDQINDAIQSLPIKKELGVGLVIVAKLLDKAYHHGTYQIVFFNTETKEIIEDWPSGGEAKGFGLRNYWAGSIYKTLQRLK